MRAFAWLLAAGCRVGKRLIFRGAVQPPERDRRPDPEHSMTEIRYADLEDRLRPLAEPLAPPRPGDWLAEHREKGADVSQNRADVDAGPYGRECLSRDTVCAL